MTNNSYFQVPKELFKLKRNGDLTNIGFDIYLLMLDRYKLSQKNNFVDENGETYILYSYDELMEDLNEKSRNSISKGLKNLENLNLLKRKKRFSQATIFYLNISMKLNTNSSIKIATNESIEIATNSSIENDTNDSIKSNTNSSIKNDTLIRIINNKNNISNNNYNKNNIYVAEEPATTPAQVEEIPKEKKNELVKKTDEFTNYINSLDFDMDYKNLLFEFVKYRKKIRKSLKTIAPIKKLISDFPDYEELNEAMEIMQANEWQTARPEWLENYYKSQRVIKNNNYSQNTKNFGNTINYDDLLPTEESIKEMNKRYGIITD